MDCVLKLLAFKLNWIWARLLLSVKVKVIKSHSESLTFVGVAMWAWQHTISLTSKPYLNFYIKSYFTSRYLIWSCIWEWLIFKLNIIETQPLRNWDAYYFFLHVLVPSLQHIIFTLLNVHSFHLRTVTISDKFF